MARPASAVDGEGDGAGRTEITIIALLPRVERVPHQVTGPTQDGAAQVEDGIQEAAQVVDGTEEAAQVVDGTEGAVADRDLLKEVAGMEATDQGPVVDQTADQMEDQEADQDAQEEAEVGLGQEMWIPLRMDLAMSSFNWI